jgi:mono/diheme cytochrome c family protein
MSIVLGRVGAVSTLLLFGVLFSATSLRAEPSMIFVSPEEQNRSISLKDLRAACPERETVVEDPYHGRSMRYFAMSLVCVLDLGFAGEGGAESLRGKGLLLKALDGYTRPVSGADLVGSERVGSERVGSARVGSGGLGPGAALAYGEVALMDGPDAPPRFSAIDRRRVDPAPFYLIWSGSDQNDPHTHPWPYQLARIEVASFAEAFPQTVPDGLAVSHPGWSGYALFQRACAACHAINGQGGKIGPDLNVPKSIVEYRPIEQIKNYIRDPEATRYTNMPAHPGFSDVDLDALIAYFQAMSARKQDPRAEGDS